MPRQLTQYRVFIACPSGLEEDRRQFREALTRFNEVHAEPAGVVFQPVGWEETIGGVGRPQGLINEDFRLCDYAVFLLHDHWGNSTGGGFSSGFDEEWQLAEELYDARTLRNIYLVFKSVDSSKLRDPGPQLQKVLAFKSLIVQEKRHTFKSVEDTSGFVRSVEAVLAAWLRDHEQAPGKALAIAGPTPSAAPYAPAAAPTPGFEYWMAEVDRLRGLNNPDFSTAAYAAGKAVEVAGSDMQWAIASNELARARFKLGQVPEAVEAFIAIASRFAESVEPDHLLWRATAFLNKGIALNALGRSEEAIAAYDEVIGRFGAAGEPALRELVASALVNKGAVLGAVGRREEAISAFDEVNSRFGAAGEPALRQQVARALVNKGLRLGALGRSVDEIVAYDEVISRFGAAGEPALRQQVAGALFNKSAALDALGRREEAISACDEVLDRFGAATEPALREQVAMALVNKGLTLRALGRSEEAIVVYGMVLDRFGAASEPVLRRQVARALVAKGFALGLLGRNEDQIAAYDEVLGRAGGGPEPPLREQVAIALVNKGVALAALGRRKDAVAAFAEVIDRFSGDELPDVRSLTQRAREEIARLSKGRKR